MTTHVALSVVLNPSGKRPSKRQRDKAIRDAGGLVFVGKPYRPAAQVLSELPWVDRVVATHVMETNVGTWRRGKLS